MKIGESALAVYEAHNPTDAAVGHRHLQCHPGDRGYYFSKVQCFCFTEQTLEPGRRMDMPVSFFVDPAIMDDPDARDIKEITLSYTFFPMEAGNADRQRLNAHPTKGSRRRNEQRYNTNQQRRAARVRELERTSQPWPTRIPST